MLSAELQQFYQDFNICCYIIVENSTVWNISVNEAKSFKLNYFMNKVEF